MRDRSNTYFFERENTIKVGILTTHRATNYGAILQCYALSRALRALGHEAEVIDYLPSESAREYAKYVLRSRHFPSRVSQYLKMTRFIGRHLPLSRRYRSARELEKAKHPYDAVICGSDEIWNVNTAYKGPMGAYFLNFLSDPNIRKGSYAASFGSVAALNGSRENVTEFLKDFYSISVRDKNSQKLVEACGRAADKVADPTFLADFDEVAVRPSVKKKYLLVYGYQFSPAEERFIREVAEKKSLRIVSIGHRLKDADENRIAVSPGEWVGFFKDASYVITSFYHGTIFSILNRKPFTVLTKSKKVFKTHDLLQDLRLMDRVFAPDRSAKAQCGDIDYSPVFKAVEEKVSVSKDFLAGLLGASQPKAVDPDAKRLHDTVILGGYCVGCGGCASVADSPFKMKQDAYGRLQAAFDKPKAGLSPAAPVTSVCPFSDNAKNEDEIGQELFSSHCRHDGKIGYYLANYAGYVKEGAFRAGGSSGGMGSWLLTALLKEKLVDGVIHIRQRIPSAEDQRLFQYALSQTPEEIAAGAKSRYYPIEMSEVMRLVRSRPGRYAIVAIPCFMKSVRLLMRQDPVLKERIVFCVGLVCGHLKSAHFAKMIAWQEGLDPDEMATIDFRKKIPGADANRYAVEVKGKKAGKETMAEAASKDIYGSDWGAGFFKYKACDFCDDVLAETADITIGDAWLPKYIKDWQGTNILVVRHPALNELLLKASKEGKISLDPLEAADSAKSQTGGLRHRRDGLAYRLHVTDEKKEWRPPKRVRPSAELPSKMKKQQDLRMQMASRSHTAFKKALDAGRFSVFTAEMDPLLDRYYALYRPAWQNAARRLKRFLRRAVLQRS